jgi:hypothetical protein
LKKGIVSVLIVGGLLFGSATGIAAWDGERKGFIMGFGLGHANIRYGEGWWRSAIPNTNFKIGYAPSDKFLIHWTSKSSWFREWFDDVVVYVFGGPGLTYFFKSKPPSAYLTGGGGVLVRMFNGEEVFNEEEEEMLEGGAGFFVGVGYEFAWHWNVELAYCMGIIEPIEDLEGIFSVMFTINFMGY